MKIGDVKEGAILALDASERYSRYLPRKVEVLGIKTVEETYWPRNQFMSSASQAVRKVRRVEVKFLDEPQSKGDRYARNGFACDPQGGTRVVEAKFLLGPWSQLKGDVERQIAQRQLKAETKAAYEKRIEALLGKKIDQLGTYISVNVYREKDVHVEMRTDDKELEKLLTLAEAGQAAA